MDLLDINKLWKITFKTLKVIFWHNGKELNEDELNPSSLTIFQMRV